ncbi:MAG: AAA family ATPase, partial [Ghiorsea sp.]
WNDYHQQHGNDAAAKDFEAAIGLLKFKDTETINPLKGENAEKGENDDPKCGETDTTPQNNEAHSEGLTPNPKDMQRVNLLCAADMTMTPIDWVWRGWLACGKMHIFAGVAGTGKTTIALNFAATITRGGKWADGTVAKKGSVFVWSGEDDPQDSLLPRLAASGADMSKVHFVGDTMDEQGLRSFDPAKDMNLLLKATERLDDLRLIIVDPIVSAIAGDSHKNAEVRRSLQPLVDMAGKAGAAVLGITHFNKSTASKDPTDRVTGSLAFAALARVVMCTAKPLEGTDKRRFVRTKSNIGEDGGGFEYDLQRKQVQQGIEGQYIEWGESLEGTAMELLNDIESEKDDESSALAAVKRWLLDTLKEEPLPAARLRKIGEDHGHSWATIRRAKLALKIESKKVGFGKQSSTLWHYPKQDGKAPPKEPATILAQPPLSQYATEHVEPVFINEAIPQKTEVIEAKNLHTGSHSILEPVWTETPQIGENVENYNDVEVF